LAVYPGDFICIRKDIFDKVGGFNIKFHLSEDRDLVIRSLRYGEVKFIKKTFVRVSTRRMEEWGWFKFLLFHMYSHIYYTLFKKPIKSKYEEIR
jgi:GT2 family glycosyltransferase